ncbi:MAG: hypothetical protein L6265_08995 [Thermoplasmatales archaeon]|nr:hypothetical protein [Candidatus Thermoplasmatota archaeon]MCG2826712.1 hypothetical protein [Thermoplasmatales archaeon]
MILNINKDLNNKIDRLLEKNVFKSKQQALEIACAFGIIVDEKKEPEDTVKVDVKNFDEHKILSIITADKNNLRTKEEVVPELEKYVEAGSIVITDDFDFYDVYEKAMEMRF